MVGIRNDPSKGQEQAAMIVQCVASAYGWVCVWVRAREGEGADKVRILSQGSNIRQSNMRKAAASRTKDQVQSSSSKSIRRREFLVDPNRVELDEYMLKQIKKNKRSAKGLTREVSTLKREMLRLQDQHDDYMLLEKTRAQESSRPIQPSLPIKHQNRIGLTEKRTKCHHHKSQSRSSSRESSLFSLSSSPRTSRNGSFKSKNNNKGSEINSSKQRLSRKIEQLKAKAMLKENDKEMIKREVRQKIIRVMGDRPSIETPTHDAHSRREAEQDDYQQLLQLLKTNPVVSYYPDSFQKDSHPATNFTFPFQKKQQRHPPLEQDKKIGSSEVFPSVSFIPLKSSAAIDHSYHRERKAHVVDGNLDLKSETNLLESSPSRTPQQQESSKRPKKELTLSRCVDVRVESERLQTSRTEGSGFEGIFEAPVEVRSGFVEMSFEGGDNAKKRLRQLEFQFDQLVRQELMSGDVREKQMLSQTIRSVLWSINQLRGKLGRESGSC